MDAASIQGNKKTQNDNFVSKRKLGELLILNPE